MVNDGIERDDEAPRVAPDRPKGSGDKAPRVVAAVVLAVAVTVALVVTSAVLLWLL